MALSNLIMPFTLSLAAGLALSFFYFQGLWYTVKIMPDLKRPLLAAVISYIVRTSIVLAGFYLLMIRHPERLVAVLIGFFIMREILIRIRSAEITTPAKGAGYGNRGN